MITVSNRSSSTAVLLRRFLADGRRRERRRHRRNQPNPGYRTWSKMTTPAERASDELMLERERRSGRSRRHTELRENVLDVPGDRVLAHDEHRGDVAVRLSGSNEAKHLQLARRQSVRLDGLRPATERLDAGEIRERSQPFEDGDGG